jgi:hypothetical protein
MSMHNSLLMVLESVAKIHVQEVEECFALVVANTDPSLCLLDE